MRIAQTLYTLWHAGTAVGTTTDWKEVKEFLNEHWNNSYTEEVIYY